MNNTQDFSHGVYDENDNEPSDIDNEPEMKCTGRSFGYKKNNALFVTHSIMIHEIVLKRI
ncbi:hypothetical protein RirG_220270 [Rhizophagus irregularis DAOM 197198w]|uniref:Uncharacterized protein n=1 Tax=Rhizophagus irregularis (strain DAOM 197198w) TaxID=1432141 RepID=A0A015K949_RHIIW|nr:hypothetical protein RirG_220270 [Rhizophagus irregularis DAOM 197198w]